MKKSTLLIALLALVAPACQSNMQRQKIDDLDQQLEAFSKANDSLRMERDRIEAENAALTEQLSFEQSHNADLQNRVAASEAAFAKQSDEVDGLTSRLAGTGVNVENRGGFIVLGLPSSLSFPSGKADLNAKGKSSLKAVSSILHSDYSGSTFWVEGHTDSDQPKKSGWDSNLELSVNRALSVANYLIKDMKVSPEAVRISGHGEWKPKADNKSKDGKAANRRVEILVIPNS
ncbi:MAG: OmpA family protein [Planctomycetota bacterium]|jgi:chemotaxis protein MotB|nr:OmpA family protein [Planctomycetota bacterium]